MATHANKSRRAEVTPQTPARKTPGPILAARPAAQRDASCLCWTSEHRPAGLLCDPSGGGVWLVYQGTSGGSRWYPCDWAQKLKVPCWFLDSCHARPCRALVEQPSDLPRFAFEEASPAALFRELESQKIAAEHSKITRGCKFK